MALNPLHDIPLYCITITLHSVALYFMILQYVKLHYITLHYRVYHHSTLYDVRHDHIFYRQIGHNWIRDNVRWCQDTFHHPPCTRLVVHMDKIGTTPGMIRGEISNIEYVVQQYSPCTPTTIKITMPSPIIKRRADAKTHRNSAQNSTLVVSAYCSSSD